MDANNWCAFGRELSEFNPSERGIFTGDDLIKPRKGNSIEAARPLALISRRNSDLQELLVRLGDAVRETPYFEPCCCEAETAQTARGQSFVNGFRFSASH